MQRREAVQQIKAAAAKSFRIAQPSPRCCNARHFLNWAAGLAFGSAPVAPCQRSGHLGQQNTFCPQTFYSSFCVQTLVKTSIFLPDVPPPFREFAPLAGAGQTDVAAWAIGPTHPVRIEEKYLSTVDHFRFFFRKFRLATGAALLMLWFHRHLSSARPRPFEICNVQFPSCDSSHCTHDAPIFDEFAQLVFFISVFISCGFHSVRGVKTFLLPSLSSHLLPNSKCRVIRRPTSMAIAYRFLILRFAR